MPLEIVITKLQQGLKVVGHGDYTIIIPAASSSFKKECEKAKAKDFQRMCTCFQTNNTRDNIKERMRTGRREKDEIKWKQGIIFKPNMAQKSYTNTYILHTDNVRIALLTDLLNSYFW